MSRRYRRTVTFKKSNRERVKSKYTSEMRVARKELRKELESANKQLRSLSSYTRIKSASALKLRVNLKISGINVTDKGISTNIPSTLKASDIRAIRKALNNFKASESSTIRGLKKEANRQREHLEQIMGVKATNKLSDQDIYNLNKVWGSKDYENLRDILSSGEVENMLTDAISNGTGKINFRKSIEDYLGQEVDASMKKSIYNIYREYLKSVV